MTSERVGTSEPLGRGPAYPPSMAMAPSTPDRIASASGRRDRASGRLLGARDTGLEYLSDFAIRHALLVSPVGVVSHHAPPERDGHGVAQVFGDLPSSGEAVEDELHR